MWNQSMQRKYELWSFTVFHNKHKLHFADTFPLEAAPSLCNNSNIRTLVLFKFHDVQVAITVAKLGDEVKRSSEKAHRSSHSNGKQNLKQSNTFVNHAAIAWHEDRRKWVGEKAQHPPRTTKDPIISWSTSYEELLLTNEPFAEPIPLPEMVDFLVDIWHDDEGFFD